MMGISYKCHNCKMTFSEDEVIIKKVDMEDYFGVGGDFPDHHYQDMDFCPYCDSNDIDEYYDDEEEEEEEDDL